MTELPIFYATTVHLDHLVTALDCLIPFGIKEEMLVTIDDQGLSFTRENNHVIKIQMVLSRELFQTFHYQPENEGSVTKVSLRLDHLLDSLNINNDHDEIIECTLSFNGDGYPFTLIFENELITETAEYSTYLLKDFDSTGLILDREQLQFECIMKGDILYNALHDLKEIGCKDCYFYGILNKSTKRPLFALISRSQQGLSKIILPNERSILEKFEIYSNDSTTLLYDQPMITVFDHSTLDKIRKSSRIASKVMIRKDAHGLMTVNMLNDTKDVLRSNDRETKRAKQSSTASLPIHYPGIIIEASMLEKSLPELLDVNEIESMMIEYNNREMYYTLPNGENQSEEPLKRTSTSEVPADDSSEYNPATEELPLYF
ncbi:DNA damage checkpoint control protein RAD17 [Kluyveromyces marxianus]|uniref:DNA damage checkpoint control protein RAD17 n=2 Tax=Kluyveromyces marxianus TaxID=4911 RepID=W0TCX2_KLUMD|nr:DNA damage checkpoint control protein RAD17 [Kluyveromyces marxianus DMKU3-1042]QGN16388.1 DNA damage checkpoint control protein RAD17 [Kluyveromyces marxianus]BAO40661.1 DNA damage checkpoint control protein RAD17 [Kluyveromyces marxianus DMKU3-1042]BAP72137.1 DNA damage checkpoint control protein RAD17 [Kluyveromyces marxianus]